MRMEDHLRSSGGQSETLWSGYINTSEVCKPEGRLAPPWMLNESSQNLNIKDSSDFWRWKSGWDNCNESLFLPSVSGFPERGRMWLLSVWCYQQRKWPHVCACDLGGQWQWSCVVLITPVTWHTNDGITRDNNDFIQHYVSPWRTRISHPITSQKIRLAMSFSEHHFEPELRKLIASVISFVLDNTT